MEETKLICKTIASVAMATAIAVVGYRTENANCLWTMFFVACIWWVKI